MNDVFPCISHWILGDFPASHVSELRGFNRCFFLFQLDDCFSWMMNQTFTQKMVGNHHFHPLKNASNLGPDPVEKKPNFSDRFRGRSSKPFKMEDGELVTVETTFNVLFFVAKQMSFSFFGRNTVQNTAQTLDFQQKTSYIHFFFQTFDPVDCSFEAGSNFKKWVFFSRWIDNTLILEDYNP